MKHFYARHLIILEKSFPLLAEGESELIPNEILLCKTDKGSMDQDVFVQWLQWAVAPHKNEVNKDEPSLIILDNHNSHLSMEAIDLCERLNLISNNYWAFYLKKLNVDFFLQAHLIC